MAQLSEGQQQVPPPRQLSAEELALLDVSVIWHHFSGAANFGVKATALTCQNSLGKFDILPLHASFISVIEESIIVYTADKKTDVYFFKSGMVEVVENAVKIFLEGKID